MDATSITPITAFVKEVVMEAPGDYRATVVHPDGFSHTIGYCRTRMAADEACDGYVYQQLLRSEVVR